MKTFLIVVIVIAFIGEIGQNFWFNFQKADLSNQQSAQIVIDAFRTSGEYVRRRQIADERIDGFQKLKATLDRQNNAALKEKGSAVRIFDGRIHEADRAIATINEQFDAWAEPQEKEIIERHSRLTARVSGSTMLGVWSSVSIGLIMAMLALTLAVLSGIQADRRDARVLLTFSLFAQLASCIITQQGIELKTGNDVLAYSYAWAYLFGMPALCHYASPFITGFNGTPIFSQAEQNFGAIESRQPATVESGRRDEFIFEKLDVRLLKSRVAQKGLKPTVDNLYAEALELGLVLNSRSTFYRELKQVKQAPNFTHFRKLEDFRDPDSK